MVTVNKTPLRVRRVLLYVFLIVMTVIWLIPLLFAIYIGAPPVRRHHDERLRSRCPRP